MSQYRRKVLTKEVAEGRVRDFILASVESRTGYTPQELQWMATAGNQEVADGLENIEYVVERESARYPSHKSQGVQNG